MTSKVFWKQLVSIRIQWYKNARTGFPIWNAQCSTKHYPHPPTRSNFRRRDLFCDITNTGTQLCSPNEPFVVVLEKGFLKNKISPFGVGFEICNFVLCPRMRWLKFKKWKSIIGPLYYIIVWDFKYEISAFIPEVSNFVPEGPQPCRV